MIKIDENERTQRPLHAFPHEVESKRQMLLNKNQYHIEEYS